MIDIAITTVSLILLAVIYKQQNTIDRLTDKLMARDYGEYKRYETVEVVKPREEQEPLSYYDQ